MEELAIIDSIDTVCNIITTICTIIGLYTVFFAYKEYNHNKSKESAQKAIDVAKYFMDNILADLSMLDRIFKEDGLTDIINSVKFYYMIDFDKEEMEKLYEVSDIKEIKRKMSEIKIPVSSNNGTEIEISFSIFLSQVLNRLEYMCMHISSGLADDDYIYNSLHQVFISSMQLCYCAISNLNVSNKDKYYTNIISVYNKWSKRYYDAQEKEEYLHEELNKKAKEYTKPSIKKIKK